MTSDELLKIIRSNDSAKLSVVLYSDKPVIIGSNFMGVGGKSLLEQLQIFYQNETLLSTDIMKLFCFKTEATNYAFQKLMITHNENDMGIILALLTEFIKDPRVQQDILILLKLQDERGWDFLRIAASFKQLAFAEELTTFLSDLQKYVEISARDFLNLLNASPTNDGWTFLRVVGRFWPINSIKHILQLLKKLLTIENSKVQAKDIFDMFIWGNSRNFLQEAVVNRVLWRLQPILDFFTDLIKTNSFPVDEFLTILAEKDDEGWTLLQLLIQRGYISSTFTLLNNLMLHPGISPKSILDLFAVLDPSGRPLLHQVLSVQNNYYDDPPNFPIYTFLQKLMTEVPGVQAQDIFKLLKLRDKSGRILFRPFDRHARDISFFELLKTIIDKDPSITAKDVIIDLFSMDDKGVAYFQAALQSTMNYKKLFKVLKLLRDKQDSDFSNKEKYIFYMFLYTIKDFIRFRDLCRWQSADLANSRQNLFIFLRDLKEKEPSIPADEILRLFADNRAINFPYMQLLVPAEKTSYTDIEISNYLLQLIYTVSINDQQVVDLFQWYALNEKDKELAAAASYRLYQYYCVMQERKEKNLAKKYYQCAKEKGEPNLLLKAVVYSGKIIKAVNGLPDPTNAVFLKAEIVAAVKSCNTDSDMLNSIYEIIYQARISKIISVDEAIKLLQELLNISYQYETPLAFSKLRLLLAEQYFIKGDLLNAQQVLDQIRVDISTLPDDLHILASTYYLLMNYKIKDGLKTHEYTKQTYDSLINNLKKGLTHYALVKALNQQEDPVYETIVTQADAEKIDLIKQRETYLELGFIKHVSINCEDDLINVADEVNVQPLWQFFTAEKAINKQPLEIEMQVLSGEKRPSVG